MITEPAPHITVNGLRVVSTPLPGACASVMFERGGQRVLVVRDSMTVRDAKRHIAGVLSKPEAELHAIGYAS